MATIPSNYPSDSTDEQLLLTIKELSQEILKSKANINTVLQLSPLINLGQTELQRRILENNKKITDNLHSEVKSLGKITKINFKSSEKYSRASKIFSISALILSVFSITFSIYFFYARFA